MFSIQNFDPLLNHFFYASNDFMCITGKDGYFKKVNKAFQSLLGETEEYILKQPLINFIHNDDRERTINIILDFFKRGKSMDEIENRYLTKDGSYRWLRWSSAILVHEDYICAIAHDITEEKKKDLEILDHELKLKHFIDLIPHPVFIKNDKGEYVLVNQAQADLFSTTKENLTGKNDNDFIKDKIELDEIRKSDFIVIDEKKSITLPEQMVTYLDDETKILHTTKIPFISQFSGEINILGVSIDMTEIKEKEKELKNTNFELDNFVYHSSHDLRAPLCSLTGLLNLIRRDNSSTTREVCVNEAIKTIDKLDQFISDLTDFSRNSRLEIKKQNIDFRKIIHECREDLRFMKGAENITFRINIENSLVFVSDRQRIKIIFMNLISNAIKYHNPENNMSFLSVEIYNQEHDIQIIFRDNGIGIEETLTGKIFDMFFRASENSFGSGLGLYIVKQAIDKLKGNINVCSTLGKGTTFNITLPNSVLDHQLAV